MGVMPSTDFLPSGPSGEAFGCYLEGLFAVQSCFLQFFLLFGVGFLEVFQKAIVVVALCTSHTHLRYFASQLNVSIYYSSHMVTLL